MIRSILYVIIAILILGLAFLSARSAALAEISESNTESYRTMVIGMDFTDVTRKLAGVGREVDEERSDLLDFPPLKKGNQVACFHHGWSMVKVVGQDGKVIDISVRKLEYK